MSGAESNGEQQSAQRTKDDGNDCPICLQPMSCTTKVSIIGCQHLFCRECIREWIKVKQECPVCRSLFDKIANSEGVIEHQIHVQNTVGEDNAGNIHLLNFHYLMAQRFSRVRVIPRSVAAVPDIRRALPWGAFY
ncbi:hypothetical protein B4U79_16628 [Dinothrombium tinctorium]|uniref:RING-type E3 ubiquitin transferase n=1 Tax=Dinothrombium tinctorium TaxID=1965070 RepID=A0A443QH42_9ACAR|nr:hypothetical protein B4U79_16628 [Dinothrombium tinctorium]